jgi:Glutamine cyclotransferase
VWPTNSIVRINPASGAILGVIDLTGLVPPGSGGDVLNGIAYERGHRPSVRHRQVVAVPVRDSLERRRRIARQRRARF